MMVTGATPYNGFKDRLNIMKQLEKQYKRIRMTWDESNIYYDIKVSYDDRMELY